MAETVCSYFSRLSGQSGQSRALGDVVNAVRLRCAGVTGEVQDRRFISTVLDAYFRLEPGSSGRWHFWKRSARRAGDVEPSAAVRGFRTRQAGSPGSMGATGFAGVEHDLCGRRRLIALPGSQLGTFPYNPASGAVCRRTRTLDAMRSLLSGGSKVEVLNRNWRPGRRPEARGLRGSGDQCSPPGEAEAFFLGVCVYLGSICPLSLRCVWECYRRRRTLRISWPKKWKSSWRSVVSAAPLVYLWRGSEESRNAACPFRGGGGVPVSGSWSRLAVAAGWLAQELSSDIPCSSCTGVVLARPGPSPSLTTSVSWHLGLRPLGLHWVVSWLVALGVAKL